MTKKDNFQKAKQLAAMDVYAVRMTAWHARKARRVGNQIMGDGVRKMIEDFEESPKKEIKET